MRYVLVEGSKRACGDQLYLIADYGPNRQRGQAARPTILPDQGLGRYYRDAKAERDRLNAETE
jgi:hypothetical protein